MASPPVAALRAVVFDLDDTLVPWQTIAHWQWAWRPRGPVLSERHALAALHRSLHAWDRRRWDGVVGEAPPAGSADHRAHLVSTLHAIAGHALPGAETEAVVARFLRPMGEVEAYPDARPCVDRLTSAGLRIGVVTTLPVESAQHALKRAGLADLPLLVHGESTPPLPPTADGLRALAKALGVRPKEALVVGDLFWSDIRAAARVGFHTVLLDRRDWSPRVLAQRLRTLEGVPALALAPPTTPVAPGGSETPGPGPSGPPT